MAMSSTQQSALATTRPSDRQLAALRGASFGALVMLIVQFAIGIVVNLYVTVPAADKGGLLSAIGKSLSNGPVSLAVHAVLGLLIILAAVALVVRAALLRHTLVLVLSVVGLLAIVAAALNGARFVADGGPANASLAMALSTAVAMLCYTISLFVLSFSSGAAPPTT
jgi:uncharacterized Tic20 family protein